MRAPKPQIKYVYDAPPLGTQTIEIAPGILWARLPLPFRPNHVNVWLLRGPNGWTIVDTGAGTSQVREMWETLLTGTLASAPVARLVATHGHTDHVGLAGWLVARAGGVPYATTLVEWLAPQIRLTEAQAPMRPETLRFMEAHGCDAPTIEAFRNDRKRTHALLGEMPASIDRLRDGDLFTFGGRQWRVMVCGGHASEHASFWCDADKILIAGDQVLSTISPMIGVFVGEPLGDPLAEYLASLERFRALPADALVLPSHGLPFTGLHVRVAQLAQHHEMRLDQLARLMDAPKTSMELTHGLFPKAVAEGQGRHALSETIAHAHYLIGRGRAVRQVNGDGRVRFRLATDDEAAEFVAAD
jgi:glyoxylase-like metal-dependent hydrolase (beta-lactamase superfamily II)